MQVMIQAEIVEYIFYCQAQTEVQTLVCPCPTLIRVIADESCYSKIQVMAQLLHILCETFITVHVSPLPLKVGSSLNQECWLGLSNYIYP